MFWGLFGVDASRYVFAAGAPPRSAGRAAAPLTLLRCLMNVAVDKGEVSKAEVAAALAAEADNLATSQRLGKD